MTEVVSQIFPRPNFFIVGAQKAGTTSLYHCLAQHPQVFLSSPKDMNFFAKIANRDHFLASFDGCFAVDDKDLTLQDYLGLFRNAVKFPVVGEASVSYLFTPGVAEEIHSFNPDAKIIAVLRDPIERAYSHFLHNRRNSWEPIDDFERAIYKDRERIAEHKPAARYIERGQYSKFVESYFRLFGQERVKLISFERLTQDTPSVLSDLYDFLGLDPDVPIEFPDRSQATGVPKNHIIHWLFNRTGAAKRLALKVVPYPLYRVLHDLNVRNLHKPPLENEGLRNRLMMEFADDVLRLRNAYGFELSLSNSVGKDLASPTDQRRLSVM